MNPDNEKILEITVECERILKAKIKDLIDCNAQPHVIRGFLDAWQSINHSLRNYEGMAMYCGGGAMPPLNQAVPQVDITEQFSQLKEMLQKVTETSTHDQF